ncbi:MAG: ATP-binding protein [Planctomycetota bacterium]
MKLPRWTYSLKWRIVASYSLILIVGGVSTSVLGIRVTGRALLEQAQEQVDHDLSAVRGIYQNRLNELRQSVELLAACTRLPGILDPATRHAAGQYLVEVRQRRRHDFLTVVDASGTVLMRTSRPSITGDRVSNISTISRALAGELAVSTELVPLAFLRAEAPELAECVAAQSLAEGMVLLAAAPIEDEAGEVQAVIYTGQLLNEYRHRTVNADAHRLVDMMAAAVSPGRGSRQGHGGTVSIFQGNVRVCTNRISAAGTRAVGTHVSPKVYEAVVGQGNFWNGRVLVAEDWYIATYEPVTNLSGERIGMLGVGMLEQSYTAVRDHVTLIFAVIALFCFVLIVVVTIFLTRSLMRPLEEIVAVAREITKGEVGHRVHVQGQSELGLVSRSFNAMLDRIKEMNIQRYSLLEQHTQQWTETLEQRVQERSEQLVKTQAALDRQQRLASLGQLAAGVAHEINNPLGGILTFASLVREALPADSPSRADVDEIVAQAERCRKIVKELLEFSQQREVHTVRCNINDIIVRTLWLLEKQASFQNIEIVREFDAHMPPVVVDDSKMQQVFMNLFVNAADAMDERGTLTIVTSHDPTVGEVSVRITDTGCGIPPRIRETIFDPFFTTKEPGKGTGLGLAVVCRIVEGHGGRLEVDSTVDEGTTFTIVLPLSVETDRGIKGTDSDTSLD